MSAQSKHREESFSSLYLPSAQAVQFPSELKPQKVLEYPGSHAAQGKHDSTYLSSLSLNVPCGQFWHVLLVPRAQLSVYIPGSQEQHVSLLPPQIPQSSTVAFPPADMGIKKQSNSGRHSSLLAYVKLDWHWLQRWSSEAQNEHSPQEDNPLPPHTLQTSFCLPPRGNPSQSKQEVPFENTVLFPPHTPHVSSIVSPFSAPSQS